MFQVKYADPHGVHPSNNKGSLPPLAAPSHAVISLLDSPYSDDCETCMMTPHIHEARSGSEPIILVLGRLT